MLIDEKGLARLLKREYKHGGYKVIQQDNTTIIGAAGMAVVMTAVPRAILGLLVEHSGTIPRDCAIQVAYGMDNQVMLTGAALGVPTNIEDGDGPAARTPLTWDGRRLYQCKDGGVVMVSEAALSLLESELREPIVSQQGGVAAWYGDEEELFVPITTVQENVHLAALAGHRWTF